MTKWLFALSLVFFCFSTSHAEGFRIGIMGGANVERTNGTSISGNFTGTFMGGGYIGVGGKKLKIQADFLFSQGVIRTGPNFKTAFKDYISENASNIKEGSFELDELSIPVAIGINLLPKVLWLEIGPQYTAIVSITDERSFLKETEKVFTKGYISGIAGLYLELPLNFNLGVRYIAGISDRNNTPINDIWKTDKFQVRLGFSIAK